jgi:hypothetical protein
MVLELAFALYTLGFALIKSNEFLVQKLSFYLLMLFKNPSKLLFIVSLACNAVLIPMRLMCVTYMEDTLLVVSFILMSTYFLYFGRGFKVLGTFVFIFDQIIKKDVSKFILIYCVFLVGFSQGE